MKRNRRKKNGRGNGTREALAISTIEAAVTGNKDAMEQIIQHYDSYITKLSSKEVCNKTCEAQTIVDEELKSRLIARLKDAIPQFQFPKA